MESEDAKLFQRLHIPGYVTTANDRDGLCAALALQASRHPDVLGLGVRRSRELGRLLADVHTQSLDQFQQNMAAFGVEPADAHDCYVVLVTRTKENLAAELAELTDLSPQSSQLPSQDAIRAMPEIMKAIQKLELCLLDIMPPAALILGDTPLPQSDLSQGFSVPLSQSLAVIAVPTTNAQITLSRRTASMAEVAHINRNQWETAREVVIGPSASLLANL